MKPHSRRAFIKQSATLSALAASGLLNPVLARSAWLAENFTPNRLEQTLKHLFTDAAIIETDKIAIKIPQIAENGAVVPITVSSSLDAIKHIFILVEKNPVPLAVQFELLPDLEPFVSARIKMAETSDVIVIVQSNGVLYSAKERVKVTIGGCGG
jgi:sulfur-oxidizing protein SoxY